MIGGQQLLQRVGAHRALAAIGVQYPGSIRSHRRASCDNTAPRLAPATSTARSNLAQARSVPATMVAGTPLWASLPFPLWSIRKQLENVWSQSRGSRM